MHARTYNQNHTPRAHTAGRRISIYWTWSYPWEAQRDPASMENRFSTMTEVRNVLWPGYETRSTTRRTSCRASQAPWNCSTAPPWLFRNWPRRPPGIQWRLPAHRPSRLQAPDRRTRAGRHRHAHGVRSRPSALRTRSRPRRDRGDHRMAQKRGHLSASGAPPRRRLHRRLQPAPGRVRTPRRPPGPSPTTLQPIHRSLMRALEVPVHNTWGLRPAVVEGTKEIAPLTAIRDLDSTRLLDNVTTFNFHPHLPHYELTAPESDGLRVLGRQRVDPNRPHPFTEAGNTEFNALLWMPPTDKRAGDILLVDLHELHDPLRRHRQPKNFLAQRRHHEIAALVRMARKPIAHPQGRDDDHRRDGHLRTQPNRPGPNRTERCLAGSTSPAGAQANSSSTMSATHSTRERRRRCGSAG